MTAPFKKVVPFEEKAIQENGTFTGYGSTFGGKPDSYGDIIAPGAFSKSIAKNGRGGMGIAMLYQHNHEKPLGVWKSIVQDSKGMLMDGQLAMKTQLGAETYELMLIKALRGLSIGFDMPRLKTGKVDPASFEINEKNNTRLLKEIDLWETSPVTFAANTRANIIGVKSLEEAKTPRELEQYLRDLGISRKEAVHLASMCKSGLRESGTDKLEGLLETMKAVNVEMKLDPLECLLKDLQSVNSMLK